jgi:hypothetical protein
MTLALTLISTNLPSTHPSVGPWSSPASPASPASVVRRRRICRNGKFLSGWKFCPSAVTGLPPRTVRIGKSHDGAFKANETSADHRTGLKPTQTLKVPNVNENTKRDRDSNGGVRFYGLNKGGRLGAMAAMSASSELGAACPGLLSEKLTAPCLPIDLNRCLGAERTNEFDEPLPHIGPLLAQGSFNPTNLEAMC